MRNGHPQSGANNSHVQKGKSNGNTTATIRCVLVGDACVGKTALIVAYTRNGFSDRYVPTAFDNYSVTVNVDDKPLKLELCDTAGRSEFDTIRPLSYADANIFLLCFSVVKPESLRAVTERWLPELRAVDSKASIILVGTQSDLRLGRLANGHVSAPTDSASLSRIAGQYQAEYIECSAVTQHNLKEVFDLAILYGLNRRCAPKAPSRNPSTTLRNSLNTVKNKSNAPPKSPKKNIKSAVATANTRLTNGLNAPTHAANGRTITDGLNGTNPINGLPRNGLNATQYSALPTGAAAPDRNGSDNKSHLRYYGNNHANINSQNGVKVGQKGLHPSSPYGNWTASNENHHHHRPAVKVLSRNGGGGCAFESHSTPTKPTVPPNSTTFKDGFRKLISMTRRFL